MQAGSRRIRKHVEYVKFRFCIIDFYFISLIFGPISAPFFFYFVVIVFHVQKDLLSKFQAAKIVIIKEI